MDPKGNTIVLEGVIQVLEDEKDELETKLETEIEESEREQIEQRVADINADLKMNKIKSQKPATVTEQVVRRSEREKHQLKRDFEYIKEESAKRQRKFMLIYVTFKAEVQYVRTRLKEQCCKSDLVDMITTLDRYESNLKQEYESLRALTTSAQDIRRKMDSCTAVNTEVIDLLKTRYSDVEKDFDADAVKETLLKLLQREDARSIYGSTVSRAGVDSLPGSQVSIKKAEVAARLASKCAEISRETEISTQRKEVPAQQEKLK